MIHSAAALAKHAVHERIFTSSFTVCRSVGEPTAKEVPPAPTKHASVVVKQYLHNPQRKKGREKISDPFLLSETSCTCVTLSAAWRTPIVSSLEGALVKSFVSFGRWGFFVF